MSRIGLCLGLLIAGIASAADVECPAEAPRTREVEYRELWRTDPDAPEYLLGNVQDVIVGAEGAIYALDVQQQEVSAFDADGSFLGSLARQGEGPGEIQQVWSMAWWGPDTLILPQGFPPRVICVDPQGQPLPEMEIMRSPDDESPSSIGKLRVCGEHAVVSGNMFNFGPQGNTHERWIGIIERDGTVIKEIDEKITETGSNPMQQDYDELESFWSWDRWTASPEGRLYVAPEREQYRIDELDSEGELVRSITRPVEPRERSEERLQELREGRKFIFNGEEVQVDSKLSPVSPQIRNLLFVDGQLWVIRDDPNVDNYARIAVHGVDGQLIEELLLKIPHDEELDRVHLLSDGRVAVVENAISAQRAHFAGFGGSDEDEEDLDVEPVVIVIYEIAS